MNSLKRRTGRYGQGCLAVLVMAWLVSAPNSATFAVGPVPESTFATVNQPVGVAATLGRLLVTPFFCPTAGSPAPQVLSIGSTGSVSVFATLRNQPRNEGGPPCFEDYIAIAPAAPNPQSTAGFPTPFFNGFTSNDVYVTQGPKITKISFNGVVSDFATLSPCAASGNGITFDQVGTFGNNMIVACATGEVWLLNGSGKTVKIDGTPTASPITTIPITVGQVVEGPDVAPLTFGSFGGQLLVTVSAIGPSEGLPPPPDKVRALNPNGTVTDVAAVPTPTAESVASIPKTKCNFGRSSATYFTAVFGANTIGSLSLGSAFTGLSDGQHALVTSEGSANGAGITLLTSTGGPGTTSNFVNFVSQNQGQAFVNCSAPLLLVISRPAASFSVGPGANGVLSVFIRQTPDFNPLMICVGNTTADRSQPCVAPVPTAGLKGTELSFDGCGQTLVPSPPSGVALALDCKFFKDRLSAQFIDKFTGIIIVKLNYVGLPGDADGAEGGG